MPYSVPECSKSNQRTRTGGIKFTSPQRCFRYLALKQRISERHLVEGARFARFDDWRQFGVFLSRWWRKNVLVTGDKMGNLGWFPKYNHFNLNFSIMKIFINLTSPLTAIKNRFYLQKKTLFSLNLILFYVISLYVFSPFSSAGWCLHWAEI